MMKEINELQMNDLNFEELESLNGGKKSGIGKSQCSYFWFLCNTNGNTAFGGCGSSQANCDYYNRYCKKK